MLNVSSILEQIYGWLIRELWSAVNYKNSSDNYLYAQCKFYCREEIMEKYPCLVN